MKILAVAVVALTLSGCSTVKGWIPSFWDDNQSAKIVDIRKSAEDIDCKQPQLPQAKNLQSQIQWFQLYSESKGWRQQDVLKIVAPMKETVDDWAKRSAEKEGSSTYCEIKKKAIQAQAKRAAEAVLGRF
jgi:flagellar basal body L-ring protein FlgH